MYNSADYTTPAATTGTTEGSPKTNNFISKKMLPGQHYAHILDVTIKAPFNDGSKFINLLLEGVDQGKDFEGFQINKEDPTAGNYKGQTGDIQNGQWPFKDFTYDGKDISRDDQMFNWITGLASQLGVLDKLNADGVTGATIEEYIENVKKYITHPELWAYFTLSGREYYKDSSTFPNYGLFFGKKEGNKFAYGVDKETVFDYNHATHIIKKQAPVATPVQSFENQSVTNDLPF